MSLYLNSIDPDVEFRTTATMDENSIGQFFRNFFIDREHAKYWGKKPENVVDVKCTIVRNDITMIGLLDEGYDTNSIDYLAFAMVKDGGRYNIMIIEPNFKVFNCNFPGGADNELFFEPYHIHDRFENISKLHRRAYICRLKVEEIKDDTDKQATSED